MNVNNSSFDAAARPRASRFVQTVRLFLGRPLTPPKERARLELSGTQQAMHTTEARTLSLFIQAHQHALRGERQKARELRGFGEEFWTSACNLEELHHRQSSALRRDATADGPARTLSLRELDELVRCAERTSVRAALDDFTNRQPSDSDNLSARASSPQGGRRHFRQIFRDELEQSPLCRLKSKMSWDAHATRGRPPRPPQPLTRFESIGRASPEARHTMAWIDSLADAALLATREQR